jgi:hypothetical protein
MTKICSPPEQPRISPWEPHGVNTTKPADIIKFRAVRSHDIRECASSIKQYNSKKNTKEVNPSRISAAGVSWGDAGWAKSGGRRPKKQLTY